MTVASHGAGARPRAPTSWCRWALCAIALGASGCKTRSSDAAQSSVDALSTQGLGAAPEPVLLRPSRMPLSEKEQADFLSSWAKEGSDPGRSPANVPMVHGRTHYGDAIWAALTYTSKAGELCLAEMVPGEGFGVSCAKDRAELERTPPSSSARQDPDAHDKSRWQAVWLLGVVPKSVERIVVRYTDCSVTEHTPDEDGVFYYLVSKSRLDHDVVPFELRGLTRSGTVVFSAPSHIRPPAAGDDNRPDYAPAHPCG